MRTFLAKASAAQCLDGRPSDRELRIPETCSLSLQHRALQWVPLRLRPPRV